MAASKERRTQIIPVPETEVHTKVVKFLAAIEGIEFAQHAIPFWTELINSQIKPEARALLSHIHGMFSGISDSIMQSYCRNGVTRVVLTQFELEKAKMFAQQLQKRDDHSIAKYFDLLKRFLRSINKYNISLDDPRWEDIIQHLQTWTYDLAEQLCTHYTSGCKPSDIGKSVSYYFEEFVTVAGTPIEYDPIYSLPRSKVFL